MPLSFDVWRPFQTQRKASQQYPFGPRPLRGRRAERELFSLAIGALAPSCFCVCTWALFLLVSPSFRFSFVSSVLEKAGGHTIVSHWNSRSRIGGGGNCRNRQMSYRNQGQVKSSSYTAKIHGNVLWSKRIIFSEVICFSRDMHLTVQGKGCLGMSPSLTGLKWGLSLRLIGTRSLLEVSFES